MKSLDQSICMATRKCKYWS